MITSNRPHLGGSAILVLAAVICFFMAGMAELEPSLMARNISIAWLVAILISVLLDWLRGGLRGLIRVDLCALLALYLLLFFEFLFPQSHFDSLVFAPDVVRAAQMSQFGLGAFAIGRHFRFGKSNIWGFLGRVRLFPRDYVIVFFGAFILSFLPQWMAVGFIPMDWVDALMAPRFSQPWARGRYGNLAALFGELQILSYIVPPLAGVIFSRRKEYGFAIILGVAVCLIVLYFAAFCSGTRNIFGIKLAGLLAGYYISQPKLKLIQMGVVSVACGIIFIYLAGMMLEFRNMGLNRYIEAGLYKAGPEQVDSFRVQERGETGYFVDYNLWRFSQMVSVFPDVFPYLGGNLYFVAATKPIPRAIWPNKPLDLAVGLEQAIGISGMTIAVTWIGEAYVAGGALAIILTGLAIGAFCAVWNGLASCLHNPYPLIVFASGFYSTLLLMRSLMFFTTSLLPSIALIVLGGVIYMNRKNKG